jgi:hypothetical protein
VAYNVVEGGAGVRPTSTGVDLDVFVCEDGREFVMLRHILEFAHGAKTIVRCLIPFPSTPQSGEKGDATCVWVPCSPLRVVAFYLQRRVSAFQGTFFRPRSCSGGEIRGFSRAVSSELGGCALRLRRGSMLVRLWVSCERYSVLCRDAFTC